MGWTLTAVAARLGGRLRMPERLADEPASSEPLVARAFARALERSSGADAKALLVARDQMGDDARVLDRAVASGAPLSAIAALAAAWDGLDPEPRRIIAEPVPARMGPVRWGRVDAVQVDQTTCGAAVMATMLLMGDPFVGLWLATGRTLASYIPPEALHVQAEGLPARTIEDRWHALQRVLHAVTTASAVGPVAWPKSLGTPPWKVDDRTRFAGLRFAGGMVDDSSPEALAPALVHVRRALADGIPVPMFTAGDSRLGIDTVIPRHVVLIVGDTGDGLLVYEPGAGAVLPLLDADLRPGGERHPALGNWTRAAWLVLPVPVRRG
ncbi:hypothetical protein [Demequina pelophila]|uniref:hypothetical protein n=1 Tax=Demequina pelophila TaxID=1638984 RepID=UPI0007846BBA|nr:hypothetical protein [Demequina pelophila]